MSPDTSGDVSTGSRSPLALCWIVYGIIRVIFTMWMLAFAGTATVMFGALLTRVPNPYSLMSAFHIIYTGWIIMSAASGIFGILAGIALLSGMGAARLLALVAAFFSLPFLPVGDHAGNLYAGAVLAPRLIFQSPHLHRDGPLAFWFDVPARRIACVRKPGMHTGKGLFGI